MMGTGKTVLLKSGVIGKVVDTLGDSYVIDIGSSPDDWDTIVVDATDVEKILD